MRRVAVLAGRLVPVVVVALLLGLSPATVSHLRADSPPGKKLTVDDLALQVESEGLGGSMHAARHESRTYVFTWWDAKDFFHNFNFSLVPGNAEVARRLATLDRHQAVRLKGRMVRSYGTQPHIVVESLEPGEKWDPGVEAAPAPESGTDLRQQLSRKSRIHALVHAVGEDAGMLVIEYGDRVVPVVVPDEAAVREAVGSLYRGDRIELQYRIQEHPKQPTHLALVPGNAGGKPPLVVTDRIHALHGKERTVEGHLVLFPKSPVLRRTIYGVEERGPDGLHRYFTIFNFKDLKDQDRIDALLKSAWSSSNEGVVDGRNKYIHTGVRVRVTGEVSNPAQNQANPTLVTRSGQVEVFRPQAAE